MGPAAIFGSAFNARRAVGISTPNRHAAIIATVMASVSTKPTPVAPFHANAASPTMDPHPRPSISAVRNSLATPRATIAQWIGPSDRFCRVRVSDWMLTASASVSTTGMNSARTTRCSSSPS